MITRASPPLLLGQRWVQPLHQNQQLRSITTPPEPSLLDALVPAAVVAAPLLWFLRRWRRRRINKELEDTLSRARGMKDPKERQQVFFAVAQRFAANHGSTVKFWESFEKKIAIKDISGPGSACNTPTIGPHNFRFAIDRKLLKCKLWVAVDAEFDFSPSSQASSRSRGSTRAGGGTNIEQPEFVDRVFHDPLTATIGAVMVKILQERRGQAEGTSHVPDEVDLEILVWDTIIPLKLNTRKENYNTHWIGKMGDSRPSKHSWFIIPIPFFFDF